MKQTRPVIGLIGLGNAGMALAAPLLKQFDVAGYDRDARRNDIARQAGVQLAASAQDLVSRCEIVLLSLPTPGASRAAAREMAQGDLAGRLIIETSTVAPDDIQWLQAFAEEHGASVMDSAIVGGVHKLSEGKTTFLVGASDADYARAKPVLDAAAEEIFHLGLPGSGMRAKLVNNAIAHTTMVMLMEGAALAKKAGVPMKVFYTLMQRESGLMRPLTHRVGERIRRQDFEGGMPTANARKDSMLILELARDLGVPLFTMQASHTVYEIAQSQGLDRLDYASISKLWENWLDIEFGYDDE
ncbi:NAD(P)-dependent oxidoreductase [Pollutimonas bauzanensis]|uniref:3-hydroxyisobutyrate dehydrogenase n=1 Tax=Pollutimonas bauzanensis TaxID=658167 RepID=A0A1M5URN8_9BURK|nr:NAD(P)-dependent oxidoreductase [Pollutimonas bauzanensis]SHH65586.1 3-hydroxyisobutyrate dehydrogenase [Pollutimonas bauzanensis]